MRYYILNKQCFIPFVIISVLFLLCVLATGTRKSLSSSNNGVIKQNGGVWAVAFLPDGKNIAGGCFDHHVRIWDVETKQLKHTLKGHKSGVNTISVSSDGKYIASGSGLAESSVRIWDLQTGRLIKTLTGFEGSVFHVTFSPDNKLLAVVRGGRNGAIELWDTSTYKRVRVLTGNKMNPVAATFSPNGVMLASGVEHNDVKIWDIQNWKIQSTLIGHMDMIYSVTFSPDNQLVISASLDGTVKVWDISKEQLVRSISVQNSKEHLTSASVVSSPEGRIVATTFAPSNIIQLWDINTGKLKQTFKIKGKRAYSIAFSPDGLKMAYSSDNETIEILEVLQ